MTVDSRFLVGHAFANLVALLVRDETAHRRCKYRVHSYIARSFPTRRAVLLVSRVAYDFFIVQLARETSYVFLFVKRCKEGEEESKENCRPRLLANNNFCAGERKKFRKKYRYVSLNGFERVFRLMISTRNSWVAKRGYEKR